MSSLPPIRFRATLAAALLLLAPWPADAADTNGRFAIKGAGLGDCADFLAQRELQSTDFYLYAGWIDGYLTAYNRFRSDTYDVAPWQTTELLAGLVAGYCKRHPTENFAGVVDKLLTKLHRERLAQGSALVDAVHKGHHALVYEQVLERVARALNARGIELATRPGVFDGAFAQALEQFQKQAGIPVTGLPDYLTLYRLFDQRAAVK